MRWPKFTLSRIKMRAPDRKHASGERASGAQRSKDTVLRNYVLDCRIESGAHLFYAIQPDGSVVHVAEPGDKAWLVSAVYAPPGRADDDTADDYRFGLPRKMPASQAASYIQRELGLFHKLRCVVGEQVAWAALEDKVTEKTNVLPFSWALERLMGEDNLIPPCVTGVLFGEADLLVLMAYPGNGRAFVQTSVSPDNLAEILTSFAAISSISIDIETVPIYTGAEFLRVLPQTPAYPIDADILGVPISYVMNGVMVVTLVFLLLVVGAYGYLFHKIQLVKQTIAQLTAQTQRVDGEVLHRLMSNPAALGKVMAVDYPRLLTHAEAFWVEGGRVESHADGNLEDHTLVLPLAEIHRVVSKTALQTVFNRQDLPVGCRYMGYAISSTGSELRADYVCGDSSDALISAE